MARKRGPVFIELLGGQSARGSSAPASSPGSPTPPFGSAPAASPESSPSRPSASLWTRVTTDASGAAPIPADAFSDVSVSPAAREPSALARGPIVVPLSRLGWAVAGVALVVVLVWAAAYRIGENAGRRSIASQLETRDKSQSAPGNSTTAPPPAGPTRDPIADPPAPRTASPATRSGPQQGTSTPTKPSIPNPGDTKGGNPAKAPETADAGAKPPPPNPVPAQPSPTPPTSPTTPPNPGPVTGDPRVPATNYLVVATLLKPDAQNAVARLIEGGVQAFTLPERGIDPKSPDANNQLWRVMALPGIPSGEWSAAKARRTELERQVKKIGRRWKEESRAPTDFSQTYWDLYRQ